MNTKIKKLKNLFLQKISLDNKVDDAILGNLDEILYSLNSSTIDVLRQKSANLSHELHELGSNSVPYLLMLLFNKLEAVSFKPTNKRVQVQANMDENLSMDYFKRCFEHCAETGIRIFTFKMPALAESNEKSIYCSTRAMLDRFIMEPINTQELNAEIPPRAICLGLSKILSHKLKCQNEFYIQFSSILTRMNRDGLYQEARDYAEEALLCSYESKKLYFGYYVKLSLYNNQMNIIDTLLNGCLLLTSLCQEEKVCDELIKKVYIEIFLALRNFNFYKYSKNIYKNYVVNLNLEEYDKQKCDLAMFYLGIMESDSSVVRKSNQYAYNNKENIVKFGKSSLTPWLAFICNLKSIFPSESIKATSLNELESEIITILPSAEVDSIKNKILKDRSEGKDTLKYGLINLSRTRNKSDLIHEVNQLVVTANRVIETSISRKDIEGVLLGHQLKSDGSVHFNNTFIEPKNGIIQQDFNLDDKNSTRFEKYLEYVEGSLSNKAPIQFVWIGLKNDKLYSIIFENGAFTFCDYVESTNKKEIRQWIESHLPNLAFNDTPNTGSPFITREDCWVAERDAIFDALPSINIPISSSEIVLFSDVEFSSFPHNMIKSNGKIIAIEQGISSPLSFDNYLKYGNEIICTREIFAWAPIVEGDIAISIAFSKLKEQLNNSNVTYDESLIPTPDSDINIFISHGGRSGNSGFSGLYPASGKAYNTENIFGNGKIAILFVCHSGSIIEHYYSNSTHTLVKKMLQDGYEAVISPSWSLNVSIPGFWTKEFIKYMNSGINISESVYKANLFVDSIYLSLSASAAMHLFGNSNLKCA